MRHMPRVLCILFLVCTVCALNTTCSGGGVSIASLNTTITFATAPTPLAASIDTVCGYLRDDPVLAKRLGLAPDTSDAVCARFIEQAGLGAPVFLETPLLGADGVTLEEFNARLWVLLMLAHADRINACMTGELFVIEKTVPVITGRCVSPGNIRDNYFVFQLMHTIAQGVIAIGLVGLAALYTYYVVTPRYTRTTIV